MKPYHPFTQTSDSTQKHVFIMLVVFTLLLTFIFIRLDVPLKTSEAPMGIVSFELAMDFSKARAIMNSWDGNAQIYAIFGLGLDYLYLFAYSFAIGLACIRIANLLPRRLSTISTAGIWIAWALWLAALLDATENYALMQLMLGSQNPTWALVSFYCALPKFAIIAVGLCYVIIGAGLYFANFSIIKDQKVV
jgi:hypothetical protein